MVIYVKKLFYFHIVSFFWFYNMILSDALILPITQLKLSRWWRHKLGHTWNI